MAVRNLAHYPSAEAFADKLNSAKILTEKVVKQSEYEKTHIVYLALPDGSREGPYLRKIISSDAGLGNVYKLLFDAQSGKTITEQIAPQANRGIPWIYAYKERNGKIEIIEEFIDGVDLATFCAGSCSETDAIEIALSLCRAVSYLHEGFTPAIIHRDIKPENIIVRCDKPSGNLSQQISETICSVPAVRWSSQQNKYKYAGTSPVSRQKTNLSCDKLSVGLSRSACLIDFGIARSYDNTAEKDTRAFGTKGYAPPEQFGFAQTDERSDIYSLGKVLEFLFGSVNDANAHRQANTLASLSAKITQTACAFDPENRFNSVEEIITILEDYKRNAFTHNESEAVEVEATLENANSASPRKAKDNSSKTSTFWIAYDIILVFVFVLLSICAGSYFFSGYTNTIVDASSKAAALEPIVGFIVIEVLIFLPALVLLFYKKPLYERWPSLPKLTLRARIIMVVVCAGLIMVSMFILQAIAAS